MFNNLQLLWYSNSGRPGTEYQFVNVGPSHRDIAAVLEFRLPTGNRLQYV
jgi:hypothetical protein